MAKQAKKWRRVRPGLYELTVDGVYTGMAERGSETGVWWWDNFEAQKAGNRITLKSAKADCEKATR